MDFWQVILASSVVSTAISLAVTSVRDHFKDQRDRRSEGQIVARGLEQYVRSCGAMLEQASLARSDFYDHDDTDALSKVSVPAFDLPNVSWKLLDFILVDRVKGFPDRIASAEASLLLQWTHGGVDDLADMSELQDEKVVDLAQDAWNLAVQIRSNLRLPTEHAEDECSSTLKMLAKAREEQQLRQQRLQASRLRDASMWDEPTQAGPSA